jgi:S-adenosylmethionine:tRNA ribosyltransferase-isomerase
VTELVRHDPGPAEGLAAFDFDLPPERIAQEPAERREAARLLVLCRADGGRREARVSDLPKLLRAGDLLVFNDTRVRPARLFGRSGSGGAVELLCLREREPGIWDCLGRPARRLRAGAVVSLPGGVEASVVARLDAGRYAVRFPAGVDAAALLESHGELPLPPYIKRPDGPTPLDRMRYQTVFARRGAAVAAPTAGLHFSAELLAQLAAAGIESTYVTLDVGPGTFLPVRSDSPQDHPMEAEWAEIPDEALHRIAAARGAGRRVIAVGTTVTRTLESAAAAPGRMRAGGFWADAFIRPGFRFQVVDALITNFHLPRSTLLMLVSAFAGREPILAAYAHALAAGYRFYSYGDAMLIE